MKRSVAFVAIAAVALVIVAAPAFAISGVNGSASTDNTILKVQVGNTVVKLATDTADSLNTSTLKAIGQFISGQVGDATLPGGVSKSATKSSESGSKNIGSGVTKTVPGLASITLQGGSVAANVTSTKVSSAVDFVVGSVNALNGFTNLATTNSSTDSSVGKTSSIVSRDISIGKVDVLDLRTLLDQLGVDPLAMACGAVASTGAAIGVDTSSACSDLTSVTDAITGGSTEIEAVETVLGVLETALAPLCLLAPAGTCTTVTSQIDGAQSTIDAFQADPSTACSAVSSTLGSIGSQGDTVLATLNGLSGGALPDISAIIAPVTAAIGDLDAAKATLDTACNTLLGIVDDLLDTPLLSLDLIKVSMDLAAKAGPAAAAAGTIGALKVGNLTVVDANDLVALGSQLNGAINTVESTLGTALDATGLGLAAPSLDLLKVTSSKGKNANGFYFANASMKVLSLAVPSAVVELPSTLPLGALGGLGSFAPAAVQMSAVTTPAVSVEVASFSGSAIHKASPGSNPGGDQLPVTGVADSGLAFAGMLTLIGAAFIRRMGSKVF